MALGGLVGLLGLALLFATLTAGAPALPQALVAMVVGAALLYVGWRFSRA